MSQFQTAFQLWTDQQSTTLNQWSERCSIQAGVLYRLRSGTKAPTFEIMERLLPVVATHDSQAAADRLLIAYLQDQIPAGFAGDLRIELRSQSSVTPDLLEAALSYHAARAAQDSAYAEHLITLYLLARETDLERIEQLVDRWQSSQRPEPPSTVSHLRSTTEPQDTAKVAEDPTTYGD